MCVIIDLAPGKTIPGNMLDTACDINKHGFGLSWAHKGKIETIRDIKDNDPKEIADLLQKHTDKRLFLHLRHATMGKVIVENSHPFIALDKQLGFMHNGTLYAWKPAEDQYSDSKCFFDQMLMPMARMARKYSGPEYFKTNNTFKNVIRDYRTGQSVFVIFDGLGNSLRFGESHGKQFDGFWASNDYSFETYHHRSSAWGSGQGDVPFVVEAGGSHGHSTGLRGTNWIPPSPNDLPGIRVDTTSDGKVGNVKDFFNTAHAMLAASKIHSPIDDKDFQCKCSGGWIDKAVLDNKGSGVKTMASIGTSIDRMDSRRTTFVELSGIKSIWDLSALSEDDLTQMATEYPAAAASAIIDLMCHLRRLEVMKGTAEVE